MKNKFQRWFFSLLTFPLILLFPLMIFIGSAIKHFPTHSVDIPKGKEFISEELVQYKYVTKKAMVYQNNKVVGDIVCPVYTFSLNNVCDDSLILCGWVWSKSVHVQDDSSILMKKTENIRVAANRTIFARLYKDTKGRLVSYNSKNSWLFAKFHVSFKTSALSNNEPAGFFKSVPVTPLAFEGAGEYPDEISPEAQMLISIIVIIKKHKVLSVTLLVLIVAILAIISLFLQKRSRSTT